MRSSQIKQIVPCLSSIIILMATALAMPTKARADSETDMDVCRLTPDSPAKQKCTRKLLPFVKHLAFNPHLSWYTTGNLDLLISWEDYLGIRDSDYDKAKSMIPIVAHASELAGPTASLKGILQAAGYYDSLGSQWKKYASEAKKSADSCGEGCGP